MGSNEIHFNVLEGSDGQSHKTVSTNHNLFEEKGEPKRYRTEVLPLTSLTRANVLLFRYPFHPSVTAVARKRSRSFCLNCRWEVTAKDAYTLRMWLCVKWHGAWLYGVHKTRRDGSSFMWHQPYQRCKYTTSVHIQKRAIKPKKNNQQKKPTIHSRKITYERSESAREVNKHGA